MLFKLSNARSGRNTHCGVLEFVADEGKIYLPYWVSQSSYLYPVTISCKLSIKWPRILIFLSLELSGLQLMMDVKYLYNLDHFLCKKRVGYVEMWQYV